VDEPTLLAPARQLQVLEVVRENGPICTRHVALRCRLPIPVASLALNQLADMGLIDYRQEAWTDGCA
jgi:predicted transcriptional regulator